MAGIILLIIVIGIVLFRMNKKRKEHEERGNNSDVKGNRYLCVGDLKRVKWKQQIEGELSQGIYGDEYHYLFALDANTRKLEREINDVIDAISDMIVAGVSDSKEELWDRYVPRLKEIFEDARNGKRDVEDCFKEVNEIWVMMDGFFTHHGVTHHGRVGGKMKQYFLN